MRWVINDLRSTRGQFGANERFPAKGCLLELTVTAVPVGDARRVRQSVTIGDVREYVRQREVLRLLIVEGWG